MVNIDFKEEVVPFWEWLRDKRIKNKIKTREFLLISLLILYGQPLNRILNLKISDISLNLKLIWFNGGKVKDGYPIKKKLLPYLEYYIPFCELSEKGLLFVMTRRWADKILLKQSKEYFNKPIRAGMFIRSIKDYSNKLYLKPDNLEILK